MALLGGLLVLSLILVITTSAPVSENKSYKDEGEYGEYFEGDMLLTETQRKAIENAMDNDADSRNGLLDVTKHWPNKTVVYHINTEDFDAKQVEMIKNALSDIANNSCVKFREKNDNDKNVVIIQSTGNGCYSTVGFVKSDEKEDSKQVLNLAKGCVYHGIIVHEMLHTLGFYHMQSTYDRDDYVTILWENIKPGMEHNFAKYNNDTITDYGVKYDYDSVMHYEEYAFSKNGNKTITPKQENAKIGQRDYLSESDILKLNKMYCKQSDRKEEETALNYNRGNNEILAD